MHKKSWLQSWPLVALATVVVLALVAVTGAAVLIYSGLYNVAATRQHFQVTHTVLELAMRQAVRLRAREIVEPPLADERMQVRGAACFRDKCVQCHGAPGVAQGDIGKSMQPIPGPLVDASRHWRPRELFWVTSHGIKMSGMPAWEYRLTESQLWDVVAFMQQLPQLNAQQYAQIARQADGSPSCGRGVDTAIISTAVDVERGRQALHQYACSACHTIPGVTSSKPLVGPPLDGMGSRRLIAGTLPNTPENLAKWLVQTQAVKPGTAMPQLDVAPQDARDMAAYLGTLR